MRIIIITIALGLSALSAQSAPGSIGGLVVDQTTKEPIFGAVVAIVGPELGANTDQAGRYRIGGLEPGYYNVRISMMSYKTIMKNRVMVRSNAPTVLDIELEPNPLKMKGIVVKPTFFEKAKDAPVSSQRLDFEEIISQPGGSWDVQRAIQALPAVVSGADMDNEIIVRGGNYGENLFVIDNIEVANPNHFGWEGTGGGPVTMINTDYVRQADFIAGAFPAKYGDKASSVLDIKYREGLSDRLHAKVDIGMAGFGGNFEGPIGSKGSYMISGHQSFLSLIASSFGMTAIPIYYDIQGKAVYNLRPDLKLSVIGVYGQDKIDIDPGEDEDQEMNQIVKARSHQYLSGVNIQKLFTKGYGVLTFSRTKNHWNEDVTDSIKTPVWKNISSEINNGAKADVTITPYARNELAFGLFVKRPENYNNKWMKPDTMYLYYPGTDSILANTGNIVDYQVNAVHKTWKYGGYLQYRHDWGSRLTTNTGVRFDRFEFTGHSYLSPRLGMTFHLAENSGLNLALGRSYQSPEWFQLSADTANHRLKSKYTDQIVVGVEQSFSEDVRATLEAYYKIYRDVPIPSSMATADPNDWSSVYVNQGTGYAKGVEFFLQKKVKENLWGTLSYAYSIAQAKDPRDAAKEYNWDFDYRHVFSLISGYRKDFRSLPWYQSLKSNLWYKAVSWLPFIPADESELSFKYRYLGGKPYTPQKYHPEWRSWTIDPDMAINSARTKPYNRFDLLIHRRWFMSRINIRSYLEIDNLFNTKNVWGYNYNEDGTISTIYQFGRMIIGGVVLEF